MNKLRAFRQGFRKVDKLIIVFDKKDTIYLIDDEHKAIIHRWFKVRNSYVKWHLMCMSLKSRKYITYEQALSLAHYQGFNVQSAISVPDITKMEEIGAKYEKSS